MNREGWIIVPNWDKFQHYKDRTPVWIKLYLEVLDRDDFASLTDAQMGVLVRVWCMYARCQGSLSVTQMAFSARSANILRHLESLNHAGLITIVASKPLAQRREELREEKKEEPASKPDTPQATTGPPARVCPECGIGRGRHLPDCPQTTPIPGLELEGANAEVMEMMRRWLGR